MLVQLVFTLGLALFVSALTVHFRDIQNILGHLLHLWFFASPVLYLYGDARAALRTFLRLNPMSHVLGLVPGDPLRRPLRPRARASLRRRRRRSSPSPLGAFLFDRLRDTLAEEV